MLIIEHRINWVEKLRNVPSHRGVEIDIRSMKDDLILAHDPFTKGELFEEWLQEHNGQFLVLNVKEEGLEELIIRKLEQRNITDYFFLDQSFPFLVKLLRSGNFKTAVRISDYESFETAMKTHTEWVWLDSFNGNWEYLIPAIRKLRRMSRKMCLVLPELQGRNEPSEIKQIINMLNLEEFRMDAICTKEAKLWENY